MASTTTAHSIPQSELLKNRVPANFQILPRELRQQIISYAFNVLYNASYAKKHKFVDAQEGKRSHLFWCLIWEIAEWLKSAFPDAKEDIEYVRVTWAGKPGPSDLIDCKGVSILAENWEDERFIRRNLRSCFAPIYWAGMGWLWNGQMAWTV